MPVYEYLTKGQKDVLQRVLDRATSRGFTPLFLWSGCVRENAQYKLYTASVTYIQKKPRPPLTRYYEAADNSRSHISIANYQVRIKNEILSCFRFLIICDYVITWLDNVVTLWTVLWLLTFLWYCVLYPLCLPCVRLSYVLNFYLLIYLLTVSYTHLTLPTNREV